MSKQREYIGPIHELVNDYKRLGKCFQDSSFTSQICLMMSIPFIAVMLGVYLVENMNYWILIIIIFVTIGILIIVVMYWREDRMFEYNKFKDQFCDIKYSEHYLRRNIEKETADKIIRKLFDTTSRSFVIVRKFINDHDDISFKMDDKTVNVEIDGKHFCRFTLTHTANCSKSKRHNGSCSCNKRMTFKLINDHKLYKKVNEMLYD